MIAPGVVGTLVHLGCSTAWGGRCYHHPHRECFPVFPDHCCLGHHWVQRFEHNEIIRKARLARMFLPVAFSLILDIFPLRIRIESLQIFRFLILLEVSGASCWLVDFASNFSSIFPPQVALVLRDPWALWVPYLDFLSTENSACKAAVFFWWFFTFFFFVPFFLGCLFLNHDFPPVLAGGDLLSGILSPMPLSGPSCCTSSNPQGAEMWKTGGHKGLEVFRNRFFCSRHINIFVIMQEILIQTII